MLIQYWFSKRCPVFLLLVIDSQLSFWYSDSTMCQECLLMILVINGHFTWLAQHSAMNIDSKEVCACLFTACDIKPIIAQILWTDSFQKYFIFNEYYSSLERNAVVHFPTACDKTTAWLHLKRLSCDFNEALRITPYLIFLYFCSTSCEQSCHAHMTRMRTYRSIPNLGVKWRRHLWKYIFF